MAKINLDLTNVKAESSSMFSKVPAGTYLVSVAHSEFREGKPGAAGLQVGYMIEIGEHKGKMVQDYINIMNPNEKAVEIGLQRLRSICELQARKSFKLVNDSDLIARVSFSIDVELETSMYQDKEVENNKVKKLYTVKGFETPKAEAKNTAPVDNEEEVAKEVVAKLPWE